MITSTNGLNNTSIQDNTIQKEKAKMSREQEKALIDSYMQNLIMLKNTSKKTEVVKTG